MEPHYHVWIRAGKIFSMRERRFDSRKTAHKAAVKLRPASEDRLVLACSSCPTTRPSKRRAPRWGAIARRLAARFELSAGDVREALAAELAAERGRDVPAGRTNGRRGAPSGVAVSPGGRGPARADG